MKKRCITLMLALCALCIAHESRARPCDQVLYIAWDGWITYDVDLSDEVPIKTLPFPHYMGAVCVDNLGKRVEFYPGDESFSANYIVEAFITEMNDKWPLIMLPVKKHYRLLGAGDPGLIPKNFVDKSSPFFPYWIREALAYRGFHVVRLGFNAEPDMAWRPKFLKTMLRHEISEENRPDFRWTE